jgi:hypothetical protein
MMAIPNITAFEFVFISVFVLNTKVSSPVAIYSLFCLLSYSYVLPQSKLG